MAVSRAYLDYVLEQLAGLGRVTSRRLFSGAGLYRDGVFFGLIGGDTLYFKVDDSNRADYEKRGMEPFRPHRERPELSMSYYAVPVDALEDPDELVVWARKSLDAAVAARSTRNPKRKAAAKAKTSKRAAARRTRTVKMTTTIYGIKNCDTMKKARTWLDEHDIAYEFHDYKASGIDRKRLQRWCKELGWEKVLNRAGTTFRKVPEQERASLDEAKAIELMLAQPSMIKRPMLDAGGKLLVGFKPEVYEGELRRS